MIFDEYCCEYINLNYMRYYQLQGLYFFKNKYQMSFNVAKDKDVPPSADVQNMYCPGLPNNSITIQESSSSDCSNNRKNGKSTKNKHERTSSQSEDDPKKKRMQAIRKRFQEIEDQSEREKEEILKNPVIKRTSVQDRLEYDQLKKQFQCNKYLCLSTLREVKKNIERYSKEYKMQSANPEELLISSIRFEQKKKLFRSVRLAVQEIRFKVKQDERDQFQKQLLSETADMMIYSDYIASKLQKIFFKHLYHKAAQKKKGDVYFKQIKIVLKEFSDKNNLEFRRKVLNPKYDYKRLTTITEEELKCSKTKEEEAERVRQLIRQNQKIDQKAIDVEDQELECPKLNVFHSITDLYNGSKEDQKKKEHQRGLQKTKLIYKKAYSKIAKSVKNMSLRVAQLKINVPNSVLLNAIEQIN